MRVQDERTDGTHLQMQEPARWRAARSRRRKGNGFTLAEIMIVIAIIGLLAAVAVANLIKARRDSQATLCTAWLERIAGAKAQAAFAANLASSVTPADADILPFIDKPGITAVNGSTDICPAGGMYQVNNLDTNPSCTLAAGPGKHDME